MNDSQINAYKQYSVNSASRRIKHNTKPHYTTPTDITQHYTPKCNEKPCKAKPLPAIEHRATQGRRKHLEIGGGGTTNRGHFFLKKKRAFSTNRQGTSSELNSNPAIAKSKHHLRIPQVAPNPQHSTKQQQSHGQKKVAPLLHFALQYSTTISPVALQAESDCC